MAVAANGLANSLGDIVATRICGVISVERIGEPDVGTVEREARMRLARLDFDRVLSEKGRDKLHANARDRFALRPLDRHGASFTRPFAKAGQGVVRAKATEAAL